MIVRSLPDELMPVPQLKPPYDTQAYFEDLDSHERSVAKWLKENGFDGPNSGKKVSFQVGDGYAQYMLAEGKKSYLIHLPYGDAYHYRDVEFLPKAEILKRIKQQEGLASIFSAKGSPSGE